MASADPPPPYSHVISEPQAQGPRSTFMTQPGQVRYQVGPNPQVPGPVIMTQPGQIYITPTTAVMQQPAVRLPAKLDWSTSLYNCCEDMPICLCGTFCTPFLMCKVACDMNESPLVVCCVPCPTMMLRTKWRAEHNIRGSIMSDCCETCILHDCVLCQLAREIKKEKQNRQH